MLTTTIVLALPIFSALGVAGHDLHARVVHNKRMHSSGYYHTREHPVHALFARQDDSFPQPGTPEFLAGYPKTPAEIGALVPQEWKDVLAAAVSAGKIPNIPLTTVAANVEPVTPIYPAGTDATSDEVCSTTAKVCQNGQDIWEAPPGSVGTGFDDGPTPVGRPLYAFLKENNIRATHFMIGAKVLQNPDMFLQAYEELGNPVAGHSWSHRHHTSLTNEELLGEFGFTLRVMRDLTKGRLFKYWRPPYGDSDNRVAAVAREVFGLTAILWNHDTDDWGLESGARTFDFIQANMETWLTAPKTGPGPIILHHEHNDKAIQAFINGYPLMVANGWNIDAVSSLFGSSYQNAEDDGSNLEALPVAHLAVAGAAASAADANTSSPPPAAAAPPVAGGSSAAPSNAAPSAPSAPVGRPPRSTPPITPPSATISGNQLQQSGTSNAAMTSWSASWSLSAAAGAFVICAVAL